MKDIKKDPFEEYIRNLPPTRKELGQAWQTAIGLQDVDGLKPSEYLYETAKKNIDGEISVDEAGDLINSYYESKDGRSEVEARTEEADKVSARIAKTLSENAFTFSPMQYISIHRTLFLGIFSHAGKIRDYNFTKKEWVLEGDTVSYGGAPELREMLDYDFSQEREFHYNGLTMDEVIHHLAVFISRLWQIHEKHELHNREMHVSGIFLLGHDKPINDPINDPIKLNERELQIIELLREKSDLTRKEMAVRLDCSDSTVKRCLQSMVEKGVIKRIGSNKKGEWIILEG